MEFTTHFGLQSQTTRLLSRPGEPPHLPEPPLLRAYHPLWATFTHNHTQCWTWSGAAVPPANPHTTWPTDKPAAGFGTGLLPLHSPLLRESWLVSSPPLIDMLKFSGYPPLIRGQKTSRRGRARRAGRGRAGRRRDVTRTPHPSHYTCNAAQRCRRLRRAREDITPHSQSTRVQHAHIHAHTHTCPFAHWATVRGLRRLQPHHHPPTYWRNWRAHASSPQHGATADRTALTAAPQPQTPHHRQHT
ncbi:transcript antisense to ribosomal RNA protein [Echinococcus multilocularis]|uniref:Transcript antisense to ribosomal RNA protein n=1 Tax=Echinococcus multilocularis TaxID=6211 RepID=A0A068Y0K1_ECHMU|nr:transcript antisense to ribosomal RNA protein [Echinococcus multilocularis]